MSDDLFSFVFLIIYFFISTEALAGELFALTVFLCDGHLEFSKTIAMEATGAGLAPGERFLRIAFVLPMDLQMLLCNRTFGLGGSIIFKKESEAGFKKLGRLLAADSLLITN